MQAPLDLLESLLPAAARARRKERVRRVALAASEALVAAARSRWRARAGGMHDDIAAMVVIFDSMPPPAA